MAIDLAWAMLTYGESINILDSYINSACYRVLSLQTITDVSFEFGSIKIIEHWPEIQHFD